VSAPGRSLALMPEPFEGEAARVCTLPEDPPATGVLLTNGVIRLVCRWAQEAAPLRAALEEFLWPWFTRAQAPQAQPVDLTLTLLPASAFPAEARAACTEPVPIRRSTAAIFNLEVLCGHGPSGELAAWDAERQVGYLIDGERAEVRFYGTREAGFVHLIELVRYYGLLVEQARGTLVLHASAVSHRSTREVVGIVGAKGAGKTTTMLSMVASGDYTYFSGDKLLLRLEDGELRVRGWPDYPHIGIGTLGAHAALAARLGISLHADDGSPLPPRHKVLVPPQQFLQAIGAPTVVAGRLSLLMLPAVDERRRTGEIALDSGDKDSVGSATLFEWPHQFVTACWHGLPHALGRYVPQVPAGTWEALKSIPWIRKFGSQPRAQAMEYS
jgi:hypothetical protein